ncbi:hypothetical protein O6H91_14G037600 [Diphasiastrum complanatum]|uniref:Uncharacterized protein n=1 Tax=Diphasiastrum complanatum TaxID=34168 RepID=A0ACC2BNB5_DIPCM|nr:hypothetical protein O6H91_14G037600 [Diphasiastrum complanatum]
MKAEIYEELRELLGRPGVGALNAASSKFPKLPVDTLVSIQSQECLRRLRLQHHKLCSPDRVQQYIARYTSGEEILSISHDFDIPPCLLARLLLEHMVGMGKQNVSACLKDPTVLPDAPILVHLPASSTQDVLAPISIPKSRLYKDIQQCVEKDTLSSPAVELIRRVTGMEFELMLREKLQDMGIAFKSENALREAGFSKTPDVKLEVPIGVQGRVVNWIDSKASFGDHFNHKVQGKEQFQR